MNRLAKELVRIAEALSSLDESEVLIEFDEKVKNVPRPASQWNIKK